MRHSSLGAHIARLGPHLVLLAGLCHLSPALAQEATAPNWLPFGECQVSAWTSNRNLDDRQDFGSAGCQVSVKPKFTPELSLGLNFRAGWQDNSGADSGSQRWREAYLDWAQEAWSVRLNRGNLHGNIACVLRV